MKYRMMMVAWTIFDIILIVIDLHICLDVCEYGAPCLQ